MSESLLISLSARSSVLESRFFPPIELHPNKNYVIGLIELLTFNSIPNIDESCNKFYLSDFETIKIPTGSYEVEDIQKYLSEKLKDISFSLKANNNTLQSIIQCEKEIDFEPQDSIGKLLGFKPQKLAPNIYHTSELPVSILKVNVLRVECNIARGAYNNGQEVHNIHEFFPAVPPGFKIIDRPLEIIYLPISVKSLDSIQLRIVDQDGDLVNFRGETISIRLHIKTVS